MKSFFNIKKTTLLLLLIPSFFVLGFSQNSFAKNLQVNSSSQISSTENGNPFVEQISMGGYYSAAVASNEQGNDSLYTWGNNEYGQLGIGNYNNYSTPQEVTSLTEGDIEQISMGYGHSAAVINNGGTDELYTWGWNDYGQLGIGSSDPKNTPQKVTSLPPGEIEQISMGNKHSAAIVNDGTSDHLYTWGKNDEGQLGLGDEKTADKYNTPQEVTKFSAKEIEQISLGSDYTMAAVDNTLYSWGVNDQGQLGLGNDDNYNTPQEVTKLSEGDIDQIAAGYKHSAAIINDSAGDHLYTWGWNNDGQLGLNDNNDHNCPTTEVNFLELQNDKPKEITQVELGLDYSTAIVDQGNGSHLYAWGNNNFGQLGIPNLEGDTINHPKELLNLTGGNVKQVSVGKSHTAALTDRSNNNSDQTLSTWGDNSDGQLGLESSEKQFNKPQVAARTPTAPSFKNSQITTFSKDSATLTFIYLHGNNSLDKQYDTLDKLVVSYDKPNANGEYSQTFINDDDIDILGGGDNYQTNASVELTDLKPGTEYVLELEGTFSSSEIKETKTITSSGPSFKTLDKDSTVKPTPPEFTPPPDEFPIDNITDTTATVYFSYLCGKDSLGDPYKLNKLTVTNTNTNDEDDDWEQTFMFSDEEIKISADTGQRVNGSVDISELEPDTNYNLKLEGTFKSESVPSEDSFEVLNGEYAESSFLVSGFATHSKAEEKTTPKFESANATSITDETAIIKFTYNVGADENESSYELINLVVSGTASNNTNSNNTDFNQTFKEDEIVIIEEDKDLVTAKVDLDNLTSDTTYTLNLTGTFISENSEKNRVTDEIAVDVFTTLEVRGEETPPEFTSAEVIWKTNNSATIEFSYKVGDDGFSNPYELTKLTVTDNMLETEFKQVNFAKKDFFDVTSIDGIITAKVIVENLNPETEYQLNLDGTFTSAIGLNNSDEIETELFETLSEDNNEPPEFISSEITTYGDTTATIQFTYSCGHDGENNPYKILSKLVVTNENANDQWEQSFNNNEIVIINETNNKITAQVELENLNPDTTYNLILNGTFETADRKSADSDPFNVSPFTTRKANYDNFFFNYWWCFVFVVLLIIIIVFFVVLFFILKRRKKEINLVY